MNEDKRDFSNGQWTKCKSKGRRGRYYMFNSTTGESVWCSSTIDESLHKVENSSKAIKASSQRSSQIKTPAQDRLLRLQTDLKRNPKSSIVSKVKQLFADSHDNIQNKSKTSVGGETNKKKSQAKSAPHLNAAADRLKSLQENLRKNTKPFADGNVNSSHLEETFEMNNHVKKATDSTQMEPIKLNKHSATNEAHTEIAVIAKNDKKKKSRESAKRKSKISAWTSVPLKKRAVGDSVALERFTSATSETESMDTESSTSYNFINKIVRLCKDFVNTKTKPDASKDFSKKSNTCSAKDNNALSKIIDNQKSVLTENITNATITHHHKSSTNSITRSSRAESVSLRLAGLQRHLENELQGSIDTREAVTAMYNETTSNDSEELMDWTPNYVDDVPALSLEEAGVLKKVTPVAITTMGEYYDVVNENLMRNCAERKSGPVHHTRQWLNKHFHFVVDTNVILRHVMFIDDLTKMVFLDTKGSVVYIPYCVLQELDKLKMRENTKTLATITIKYLNKKLEERNENICGQSARDEQNHIIDVDSPDDSIINCCLQVKRHVNRVLLLSDDVNLRNKAICNNIMTSAVSDLKAWPCS